VLFALPVLGWIVLRNRTPSLHADISIPRLSCGLYAAKRTYPFISFRLHQLQKSSAP
jgi:hypothetical protein